MLPAPSRAPLAALEPEFVIPGGPSPDELLEAVRLALRDMRLRGERVTVEDVVRGARAARR